MPLELTSEAFSEGDPIPERYTCDGEDVSPPLSIDGVPAEAESLALIVDDPDAPAGTWVHWVLYGLPPDTGSIPEDVPPDDGVPGGALQGRNDFGDRGYGGPCPPAGEEHTYVFRLYALGDRPELDAGATKDELLRSVEGTTVERTRLTGRYRRS